MSGARVLVIGGAGFLGRHVVRAFADAGHVVTVLTRTSRLEDAGLEHLVADRRDPAALAAALEGRRFDLTVDLAAYDAADVERLLLIPYAALGRYLMVSSGQVYLVTEHRPPACREEDSERPLLREPEPGSWEHGQWAYGVGKRRAESALLALRASYGLRAHILRLPILQGEGDRSLRLWGYLERLLDGGPLLLRDGGTRPTRHLHAGDAARVMLRMFEGPPPREAVYNLAQPDIVPLRGLLEHVAAAAGVRPRFVDVSWDEMRAAGLSEQSSPFAHSWTSVLDPSRALAEFGLLTRRMEEYLPAVVGWHLTHRPAESHPGYAERERELALAVKRARGAAV